MKPATLKLVALGYVAKTVLIGIAWLAVPDLPQRAAAKARAVWQRLSGDAP
jgi:hypothetical protein